MKLGIAFFCAMSSIAPAMAQCGRCGPDGGDKPPLGSRVTFRAQDTLTLPFSLGSIQPQLRIDSLTPGEAALQYSATTELLLDVMLTRPVRLTEVTLRRETTPITFGVTAASPLVLPAGRSAIVLRGSTFQFDTDRRDYSWALFLRSEESPDGYLLNPSLDVKGSETIAMAQLSPPPDLDAAMVSVRASYLRSTLSFRINAAELQYDVRYRGGSAAASITGLALRSVGAFGPVLIEAPVTPTSVGAGASGTFTVRQILDTNNAAALSGLETMLRNPSSLFVELRTGSGESGGASLGKPESFTYAVLGTPVTTSGTPAGASAGGLVTVQTLRDEAGQVLAGLVNFTLGAKGFTRPGTVFSGLTVGAPPVRTLAFPSSPNNNPGVSPSGDASVYQDYPLLADDPLLAYLLTPASFQSRLNTAVDVQGAMILTAKPPLPQLSSPAMAITHLIPEVSTPGSIVSVFGRSFPAEASQIAVSVEGKPAEILYASPTQLNVRLSTELSTETQTSPSIEKTLLAVNLPKATTASKSLTVDVAEPFILLGPAIYFAGTSNPVRPETPATAGDTLEIYGTGITIRSDIQYSAVIGNRPEVVVPPAPLPGVPGVWVIRATVPPGLRPGTQPVSLFANFSNGRRFPLPQNAQQAPLAVK